MFIDSHVHLYDTQFDADRDRVISRAREVGVEAFVVPGTTVESSERALELAERHADVYACVGFHPHEATGADEWLLRQIEEMSRHPKVVAIGEIGLDFHYNISPKERQVEVFRAQLEMAVRCNLPVVVHTRDSITKALEVVEEFVKRHPDWMSAGGENAGRGRGVFHCFTGTVQEAERLFSLGFTVSYPGIVTFKNSTAMLTLREIGYDRILLETDSPYLAPAPLRGKRNEPAHVKIIAEQIAQAFSVPAGIVAVATSANARRLFGIPSTDGGAP